MKSISRGGKVDVKYDGVQTVSLWQLCTTWKRSSRSGPRPPPWPRKAGLSICIKYVISYNVGETWPEFRNPAIHMNRCIPNAWPSGSHCLQVKGRKNLVNVKLSHLFLRLLRLSLLRLVIIHSIALCNSRACSCPLGWLLLLLLGSCFLRLGWWLVNTTFRQD